MSKHELTVTFPNAQKYLGECSCGWTCFRSRERDLRRAHREHIGAAFKLTSEQGRKMQESTP